MPSPVHMDTGSIFFFYLLGLDLLVRAAYHLDIPNMGTAFCSLR